MKVVITAGGTRERIDNVRSLSNVSSGRLGQCIAEAFLGRGVEVVYIYGPHALLPKGNVEAIGIETVSELESAMKRVLQDKEVVAVVHAMAVSDYSVLSVSAFETVAEFLENKDREAIVNALHHSGDIGFDRTGKIGSNESGLAVILKPAPKIIPLIKSLRSDSILIGFKLLVDVSEERLIEVGTNLLHTNHCDFVLANDLMKIHDDNHLGYLIHANGVIETFHTKQEIALGIVGNVMERIESI